MFRLRVTTDEVTNVLTSDDLTVELRGCGGLLLPALATYSNLEAGPGYTAEDLDVTAFKGRHVDGGDDAVLQRERMVAFGIADDPRDLAAVVEPVGLRRRQLWPGLSINGGEGALCIPKEPPVGARHGWVARGNAEDSAAVVDVRRRG
jgi:hypothetical protein